MSNTLNLNVTVTSSDYRDSTGLRGRPQKHPQVTLDLSGAADLVAEHGEKKVRNMAFRALRSQLGVDSKVPCVEHPKTEGCWILKTVLEGRSNFHVTVTPGEAPAAAEPTTEG